MKYLLEVDSLNRSFGGLRAVNDVSFSLEEGTIKGIIGPNGAGKTTLFNLISGKLKSDSGRVTFDGGDISGMRPYRIARLGISRTFQSIKLNPSMSVLENVMVGRYIRTKAGFFSAMLNLPWVQREERMARAEALAVLEKLSIAHLRDANASDISFGQQRATEFARALASEPTLLLLDEPASGLNMYETAELAQLILRVRDSGISILIVEHDMSLIMEISDEIVVLNYGEKIAEGTPHEIQTDKRVIESYLGTEDA